jgi:hypothetical protein
MRLFTKADKQNRVGQGRDRSLLCPEPGFMLGFLNLASADVLLPNPCHPS